MNFLRDSMNKKELFACLSSKVAEFNSPPEKAVHVTSEKAVASIGSGILMPNCNHEEADTWIVVHITHALEQGAKTIYVRIVDTDVVIILAGAFFYLIVTQPLTSIWVAFGMGKHYRFYHINAMYPAWGASISSITGVSCLFGLRYDISLQRQEQEVGMAGLASIQGRDGHICASG